MPDFPILPGPRYFPPRRTGPAFSGIGTLGSSGTFAVPDPSPSLNPAILGEVSEKDRVRQSGFAAIGQAQAISVAMAATARGIHVDQALDMPTRHRKAHSETAKMMAPLVDTIAKATEAYAKESTKLHAVLDAPAGEFLEIDRHRALTKILGLPPTARLASIKRNIDKGSDLLVAVLTKSDAFFIEGVISDGERQVVIDYWRKARFPEQALRLQVLELDMEKIGNTNRILENYQGSMSNASIVAEGIPTPAVRGAPGPAPVNRGAAMTLEQRARATTAAIAAQGGR